MSSIEEMIRRRAYELWEHAGSPEGRTDEFWFAARVEFEGEDEIGGAQDEGALVPPLEEPPVVAVQHGVPVGMPGERLAEPGVLDDRIETMLVPPVSIEDD